MKITLLEHEAFCKILGVANALRRAERLGADKDEPEGVRYIQVSDTLARLLADELDRAEWQLRRGLEAWSMLAERVPMKQERPLTRWITLVYQAYMGLHGEALRGPGRLLREVLISMLEHKE